MAYFSSKDCRVLIDGKELVASNANLTKSFDLVPTYEYSTLNKFNSRYAPNGINQTLSITYTLTGTDFIKPYISNDTGIISGNFGGLYFSSGYLRSYSFNGIPNTPIVVNAEISVFDEIKGTFAPVVSQATTKPILNFSDVTLECNTTRRDLRNIESISYSYSANIQSSYEINNNTGLTFIAPARVVINEQEVDLDIVCDDNQFNLNIFGMTGVGVRINCNHPELGLAETFICSGILTEESFQAANGDVLKKNLRIKTNQPAEPPIITGFTPFPLIPNSPYLINGRNLQRPLFVRFGDRFDNNPSFINSTQISGNVPYDVISGNIELMTLNGNVFYQNPTYQFPTITISAFSPTTGFSIGRQNLKDVLITGSNFDRIDRVLFNNLDTDFFVYNSKSIQASVPSGINNDFIKVVSSLRGTSGVSSLKFYTAPRIYGFGPKSGFAGTTVTITGYNFNDIATVRFGDTDSPSVAVASSTEILATVPVGSSRGRIYVINDSGLASNRPWFDPYLYATGINTTSGGLNTILRISGVNFDTGIMYPTGNDGFYTVILGNQPIALKQVNTTLLTGMITETGDYNGKIRIVSEGNLKEYETPYTFRFLAPPSITSITNNSIRRNNYTAFTTSGKTFKATINGTNLDLITGIMLTGSGINNSDIYVNTPYFYSNADGSQAFITGFKPYTPTGYYHTVVRSPYGESILSGKVYIAPQLDFAPQGIHTQSSNFFAAELCRAKVAANLITAGSSGDYGISLTQTEVNPYWQVQFNQIYEIDRVVIYNSSGPEKTGLSKFVIKVMDDNFKTTFMTGIHSGDNLYPNLREEYVLPQTATGRYLRIHLTGEPTVTRWLGLAEVEIY